MRNFIVIVNIMGIDSAYYPIQHSAQRSIYHSKQVAQLVELNR